MSKYRGEIILMEAIVLAGGKGTRLQKIITDLPKPMATVQNVPFLTHLLRQLNKNRINKVILSIGYLATKISSYYGNSFEDIQISYSKEDFPLLTGGAIKKALTQTTENYVFVLNGDTYVSSLNFERLLEFVKLNKADVAIALVPQNDCSRFGRIEIAKSGKVSSFGEKCTSMAGLINSGVYCIRRDILDNMEEIFSFEKFLTDSIGSLNIFGYITQSEFIDIGIPEDYHRAQTFPFRDL